MILNMNRNCAKEYQSREGRKYSRLLLLAGMCVVSLLVFAGCSQPDRTNSLPSPQPPVTKEYVIGVSFLDQTNPYYAESWRGVQDEAANYSIRLVFKDPKSDVFQQVADVESFIAEPVDAIIIAALSPEILDPVLATAQAQGIKVIAQSTQVEHCDIHISTDEWEMGYTLGKEAGKWISEHPEAANEIAILDYPRIPQINNRVKGMIDGLSEAFGDVNIAISRSASRPEEGYASMQEIMKERPDIRVILCINDGGALGALQAVEETGIDQDEFFIGGVDATPEALSKILQKTALRCSVDIYPYLSGQLDVTFAVNLLDGESVPDRYTLPVNLIR